MSRRNPSMMALLGLLAIAGYQHRDKLATWLSGRTGRNPSTGLNPSTGPGQEMEGDLGGSLGTASPGGGAGGLGDLLSGLGNGGIGGFLGGGIGELVERFQRSGQGDIAQSWVNQGPNRPVAPQQLQQVIGEDTLADLERQTGLGRQEILARLSRELPDAVDRYTPEGRLPA